MAGEAHPSRASGTCRGCSLCPDSVIAGGKAALEKKKTTKKQNLKKPFSPSIANGEPSLSEAGCHLSNLFIKMFICSLSNFISLL